MHPVELQFAGCRLASVPGLPWLGVPWGLGLRVWGSVIWAWGLGLRILGSGLGAWDLGRRVLGLALGFRA